jgi:hypothetical protein
MAAGMRANGSTNMSRAQPVARPSSAFVSATVGDTNALLGQATGCALLMFLLPFALIPAALSGPGPLRTET